MQYDIIVVDVFNLYYRKAHTSLEKDVISVAKNVISFVNNELLKNHLCEDGKLFLLYDPITKSDLGYGKIFKYTERQNILHTYKSRRIYDRESLTGIDLVRKYFLHRGDDIISVISNKHEADDFAETIVVEFKDKKILIVSNDNDWCRYLSDNVEMLNDSWGRILTADKFNKKYGFYPSVSGVCVWKACFGDGATVENSKIKGSAGSDYIVGVLMSKTLRNANDIKKSAYEYVKWLGKHKEVSVADVEKYKKIGFSSLHSKQDKTPQDEFFYKLSSFAPKLDLETSFFTNLSVIKSRCESYKPYATAKEVDEKFNSVIEMTLGINKNKKSVFKFGKIKDR